MYYGLISDQMSDIVLLPMYRLVRYRLAVVLKLNFRIGYRFYNVILYI